MQLLKDVSEVEALVSQHIVPVAATGPVHLAVRALKKTLVVEPARLAETAKKDGLPPVLAAHLAVARAR